jgi:hypothetical protein
MNNPYLGYNPVFEQLAETARKNSNKVYEAVDIDAKETQDYLDQIINRLSTNILDFIGTVPYADLKTQVYTSALEKYVKLTNNASIRDLFDNFYAMWKESLDTIKKSKYKSSAIFLQIYAKAEAGIDKIMQAWAALQTKAGDLLNNPALLDYVNSKMETLASSVQTTLDTVKRSLS